MNIRAYRPGRREDLSAETRAHILEAVRGLLDEGTFYQATVEQIAKRAGVARATVYQHFGTRLGLVDALCETFDATPALQALRKSVDIEDLEASMDDWITNVVKFWSGEERILQQLYGVAAIDEAARALVGRQTEDRRGELKRLIARLKDGDRLRGSDRDALAHLMMLTSFETFEELRRRAQLPEKDVIAFLQREARAMLR
jgi:AcrR family transcriptional regulator